MDYLSLPFAVAWPLNSLYLLRGEQARREASASVPKSWAPEWFDVTLFNVIWWAAVAGDFIMELPSRVFEL